MINLQYTKDELMELVVKMSKTSTQIYYMLIQCNVHPFIEFNGMMNKYIDICRNAAERGEDFTESNTHTGKALKMEHHDVAYLAEKFDCIFGPSFKENLELWFVFKRELGLP